MTDSDTRAAAHQLADNQAITASDPLAALQHQFLVFRIWREDACGQVRHIARSQYPGQHAHTVVTGDALPTSRATSPGAPRFEPGAAHQAVDAKLQEGGQLP